VFLGATRRRGWAGSGSNGAAWACVRARVKRARARARARPLLGFQSHGAPASRLIALWEIIPFWEAMMFFKVTHFHPSRKNYGIIIIIRSSLNLGKSKLLTSLLWFWLYLPWKFNRLIGGASPSVRKSGPARFHYFLSTRTYTAAGALVQQTLAK